jgi:lauroyl/myristoyl acyltransferase
VFPEALEDGSFRLTIDPPLALPASGGGLGAVAAEYAHRLEPYVRERPEQWRGWHNLVPREVAPTPVYAAAAGG